MRCWSERTLATSSRRWPSALARLSCLAISLVACSSDDGGDGAAPGFVPGSGSADPSGGTMLPPADPAPGVSNYGRPRGMPIGQDAPEEVPAPSAAAPEATPPGETAAGEDVEIPVFTPMEEAPPCDGCVELNVDVNDINQRDSFVFNGGGANVTRVVWTIIVPFNSDQLFVQPFVDSSYGTFTDLDANAFAIDPPVQLVHQYSGPAGTVGLAVGSSGAWTGNMTMSVYVDSVTLEGADTSASRTFDTDAEGLLVASSLHNAKIVYHPRAQPND